jgi:hypothetical protein
MLAVGEVRSCLVQHSATVPRRSVAALLQLQPGERVRVAERPVARAVSPDWLTGVDCQLPTASRTRCRGVGTVSARAIVTGGRVLQSSALVTVERGETNHRRPWSHYLARRGTVQTVGKFVATDLATGHLTGHTAGDGLDLGAISEQLITMVQLSDQLDHAAPLRAKRTRLRWAARIGEPNIGSGRCELVVVDDVVRTLSLVLPEQPLPDILAFCENLALHDWLLSTVLTVVERAAELGSVAGHDTVDRLQPAIDHLLHLWMPGAHVSPVMLSLWESLERRAGFTRQWNTTVAHIRDQLSLTMVAALNKP